MAKTNTYGTHHYDVLNNLNRDGVTMTYDEDDEIVVRLIKDGMVEKVGTRVERVVDVIIARPGHDLIEKARSQ